MPGVRFFPADILDAGALSGVCRNVDCVCHVAGLAHVFKESALSGESFFRVNVTGTENVAHSAARAGVKLFVFISSVSVYGGDTKERDERAPCRPEGPYAESKRRAEETLIEFCGRNGMDLTILRLATLFGEGDPGNIARLIRFIDSGKFFWIGSGLNRKSLIHRDDAGRACVAAIRNPMPGTNIYNVSGPPYTMREIVETIAARLGRKAPRVRIPAGLALTVSKAAALLKGERLLRANKTMLKWLSDDVYIADLFNGTYSFQPNVGLDEGIRREVAWYRDGP